MSDNRGSTVYKRLDVNILLNHLLILIVECILIILHNTMIGL